MQLDQLIAQATVDPDTPAPMIDAVSLGVNTTTGISVSYGESFAVHTTGLAPAFFDITHLACAVVRRSGVQQGQILVSTAHTTCAVIVQENEPLLLADLADHLTRFASHEEMYRHNQMDVRMINVCGLDECANGHSHCQHALLGTSVVLPIWANDLRLGRWQRLLLVELDHPRPRELFIQATGIGFSTAQPSPLDRMPPLAD